MKTQKQFVSLASDTTIKYLYKEPIGRKWLNGIIKDLLNIDLTEYKSMNTELPGGNKRNKDMQMDLLLESGKDVVIIEIQNNKFDSKKNYFYLYRVAGNNTYKNEKTYGKATLICFNNYIPNNEIIREENPLVINLKIEDHGYKYKYVIEDLDIYEILLPNLTKKAYNNLSDTEKKLFLFLCKDYKEMEKYAVDKNTEGVVNIVEQLGTNKNFLFEYDRELAHEISLNAAKEEGIQENKVEIAKKMLEEQLDISLIQKVTGLTKEELEKIIDYSNY